MSKTKELKYIVTLWKNDLASDLYYLLEEVESFGNKQILLSWLDIILSIYKKRSIYTDLVKYTSYEIASVLLEENLDETN